MTWVMRLCSWSLVTSSLPIACLRPWLPSPLVGLNECHHVEICRMLQWAMGKGFDNRQREGRKQNKHAYVKYPLSARHFHTLFHLILRKGNLILQMRKLRLSKCLTHGLRVGKLWRLFLTPILCFSIGTTPGHNLQNDSLLYSRFYVTVHWDPRHLYVTFKSTLPCFMWEESDNLVIFGHALSQY